MFDFIRKPATWAPLFTIAAALMLAGAWHMGTSLTPNRAHDVHFLGMISWTLASAAFLALLAKHDYPGKTIWRCLFAIVLFAAFTFPVSSTNFQRIAAESLSLAALLSFMLGALLWAGAHPVFRIIGHGLAIFSRIPHRLFGWLCFIAFLSMTIFLSWYCFDLTPAYPDSAAQYINGKFIAHGHISIPSHPLRQFFPVWMMINDGTWYSQYQPLHEMLLAIGHIVHAPWLLNPLEGALTLVMIYTLARHIYGEPTAKIAALLTLTCQFMVIMSSEYMNHVTALLFVTLFIYCFIITLEKVEYAAPRANLWGLLTGLCIGAVFLTRPLSAVGIAIPFIAYALYLFARHPRWYFGPLALMALAGLSAIAFQGWFNLHTTGELTMFPYSKYHSSSITDAMGIDGKTNFHGMWSKGHAEWVNLNLNMFEWSVPCCFFVMLLWFRPNANRYSRLLLCMILSYTLTNFANQFNSGIFGPRYLYEISSGLILLVAAGIASVPALIESGRRLFPCPVPSRTTLSGITAVALCSMCIPALASRFPENLRRYADHYIDSYPQDYKSMLAQSEKPALIFIGRFYKEDNIKDEERGVRYRRVAFTNPPQDDAAVIFAIDLGDKQNQKLIDYYPLRNAYLEHNGELTLIKKPPIPDGAHSTPQQSLPSLQP
jgi:4-amino-4-deoxy-L-arabinose transferase-like glycosyltransferase